MEIRHLKTFITIVECNGFTKAAENLGYAQSTITSHIKILEMELGGSLFDRMGKRITLTNLGKKLVPHSKKILRIYREIEELTRESSEITGDLIIGVGESLTIYRLGSVLKEYKRKFPNVNITLKDSTCSDLRSSLYSGLLDISITIEPKVIDNNLVTKILKDESMVIVISPEIDINLENKIIKENIILSETGCSFRIAFENYLKAKGVKYINSIEFSSIEAIKKSAINGLGLALLPLYVVEDEINRGILKVIDELGLDYGFTTQIIYHKSKSISASMGKFIEVIEEHIMGY